MTMVEAPLDNPAGRLHRIMKHITDQDPDMETSLAFATALGDLAIADQPILLYPRLGQISALARESERLVRNVEDIDYDLYLEWATNSDWMHLMFLVVNPIKSVQRHFTKAQLLSLRFAAELLHNHKVEASIAIAEDSLDRLVELVREAIDSIAANRELPSNVRIGLNNQLLQVQNALIWYRSGGYAKVEEAMDGLTGHVIRVQEARASPEVKSWWAKLWGAISLASSGTKELSEGFEATLKAIESGQQFWQ